MLPKPNDVLAVDPDSVVKLDPSPTIKLLSVGVSPAISDNCASNAWTSDPIAKPKFVLADEAETTSLKLFAFTFFASNWVCIAEETPDT